MRWSPAALFASIMLVFSALAWSQVDPGPAGAQGATPPSDAEDCLEQEKRQEQLAETLADLDATRRGPALSPEMVNRVMQVAEDIDTAMSNRLRRLQQRDPSGFDRAMRTTGRRLHGMAELKERDPELYEFKLQELRIDKQVEKSAERLREAVDNRAGDVDQRREDLRTYVRIQVALSIKSRVEYLARLREHVAALEHAINRDALSFENTVDDRIRELLDGSDPERRMTTRFGERVPDE